MPRDEILSFIRIAANPLKKTGAGERSRTSYPRITNAPLYR